MREGRIVKLFYKNEMLQGLAQITRGETEHLLDFFIGKPAWHVYVSLDLHVVTEGHRVTRIQEIHSGFITAYHERSPHLPRTEQLMQVLQRQQQ